MMDELKPQSETPRFGSLTEIMDRFAQVPYEQFQQELNDWFLGELTARGIDAQQLEKELPGLSSLISNIYHQAELAELLSHHLTKKDDGEK
ncbi:hypothetical protein [Mucilaginibacter segetis]|uniref:Uncharacterized protein n=1 Tax=Mucilaginibacter segetis TaxID=2793071 RepID=A0A934ULG8_9SPHI|nr:hypothetical protein [Mucilaginibacter segetis]MBK0378548.1 hypothetical protein [Mucilaginibacter segetis]